MGVLSVMCEHNIITQVWEFSKIWKDPTVALCGRVSCVNVHKCERFQAHTYNHACFDLAHWGGGLTYPMVQH